jgi:hypothetical protein
LKGDTKIKTNLRRLLKYWSRSRCCGFWRWPRRERSADIRSDLGLASQRRPAPKSTQPAPARGRRAAGGVARLLQPLRGCASLAPCQQPVCLYARPTPVFQQSLSEFAKNSRIFAVFGPGANRAPQIFFPRKSASQNYPGICYANAAANERNLT